MVLNATFNNISVISWLSVLLILILIFYFWCFNATFSNIPAISWRPVLVGGGEEGGIPGDNHRPWVSNWLTLSLASRVHPFVSYKAGREPTPYWR
jgi:hypothetical protein